MLLHSSEARKVPQVLLVSMSTAGVAVNTRRQIEEFELNI
jgi:hypothetical protein